MTVSKLDQDATKKEQHLKTECHSKLIMKILGK